MIDSGDFAIEPWEGGDAFGVKAHAGAKRDAVGGCHDGLIKVEVTTAPEKGKANKAIIKLLAKRLGVPASEVVLLSGDTNPRKRFGVTGLSPEEIRVRLLPQ